MTESRCCSPETVVALLIGYTPVQNKTLKRTKVSKPKINIGKLKLKKIFFLIFFLCFFFFKVKKFLKTYYCERLNKAARIWGCSLTRLLHIDQPVSVSRECPESSTDDYITSVIMVAHGKELPVRGDRGDVALIPGSGRSPGGRNGNTLHTYGFSLWCLSDR